MDSARSFGAVEIDEVVAGLDGRTGVIHVEASSPQQTGRYAHSRPRGGPPANRHARDTPI